MRDHLLVVSDLRQIVGENNVISDADLMAPYCVDWRGRFRGSALAVVKPASTDEVAAIVKYAQAHGLSIVPQGGNTGLVGGSVPLGNGNELILSLARLNRIRSIDTATDSVVVEAGVSLAGLQAEAEAHERLFPLSLASEGTATIGGAIATNAGGTATLAYGNMRELVLGLEVVLHDGRIIHGLKQLRKDNSGYDIKQVFIGSEGTLGIVTAAALKLFPQPKSRLTAFCGLQSPEHALKFLELTKRSSGALLTTFELIPRLGLDLVLRHFPASRDPLFATHHWYVMLEFSSAAASLADMVAEQVIATAIELAIIEDGVFAKSLAQSDVFWALRENLPSAQTKEGASIKHDISVPLARIPGLIEAVNRDVLSVMPDIRPLPFGHLGDGNLHYNFQAAIGSDSRAFLARSEEIHAIVYRHVAEADGSFSAEHGIGQVKRHQLSHWKDEISLDVMRQLKALFDPDGRLNPGKVV
jgi:FAD/FMN-containing dehydrogenase